MKSIIGDRLQGHPLRNWGIRCSYRKRDNKRLRFLLAIS